MATTHRSGLARLAAIGASLLLVASAELAAHAQQAADAALDAAIAGSHRSAANKARDRYRHPKETLEFFGLRPDMTVVEIWPGGGWYTEILAPVLRERGKLYVAQYGFGAAVPVSAARNGDVLAASSRRAGHLRPRDAHGARAFTNELDDRAAGLRRSRRDVPQRAQLVPRRLRSAERRRARVQGDVRRR